MILFLLRLILYQTETNDIAKALKSLKRKRKILDRIYLIIIKQEKPNLGAQIRNLHHQNNTGQEQKNIFFLAGL